MLKELINLTLVNKFILKFYLYNFIKIFNHNFLIFGYFIQWIVFILVV